LVDVLLPETAINILPFSTGPLLSWKGKTDIRRFVDALYAESGFPAYSSHLFKREKKDIRNWSKRFTLNAQKAHPMPGSSVQTPQVPHLLEDTTFGKAAKYVIAWKSCVQNVLEESGFYSLAHILEADEEIGCSLLLASHFYYKQAAQVLRNFVEETLLPINFCENVDEFNQWKANNYHIPPLRGRDGLVKKLVNKGILPDAIGQVISDLYGDLNGYIHGSESKLINKGLFTGSWDGLIFKSYDFEAWCEYLSRSIDLGIRLLRINYVQWEQIVSHKRASLRSQGKVFCGICHNEEDFDISISPPEDVDCDIVAIAPEGTRFKVDRTFPGVISHIYRCRHCGNKISIKPNPAPQSYQLEITINSENGDFKDFLL
jgi:hypothetical protein